MGKINSIKTNKQTMGKRKLTIRTKFQSKVKSTCEKLTPKQRKAAVIALLFMLTVLCLMCITEVYHGIRYEFSQDHISPLTIPKK